MNLSSKKFELAKDLESLLSDREMLDLLLVLTSSRPACLIMDPEDKELEVLENLCQDLELQMSIFEDNGSSMLGTRGIFIYRDEERIKLLEGSEGRFYGLDDRDVGEFLGFPEEDSKYFHNHIEEGAVEPETRATVESMRKNGKLSSQDAKLVDIVSYVPKPDENGVLRALERSKNYLENIEEFDERNNTEIGKNVVSSFVGITIESLEDLR